MKKLIYILTISILLILPFNVSAKLNMNENVNVMTVEKNIIDINKENVDNNSYVTCTDDIYIPYQIVSVLRVGISFIKIGVPIIFIIMGMLDFGKVVFGKPDKEMDKAKKSFGHRLISAALVFLVVSIVETILPLVTTEDKVLNCTKCIILDDQNCKYVNIEYPKPESSNTPIPTNTPKPTNTPTPSSTPEVITDVTIEGSDN